MPIATIGIPVYQGENYLDETLQAARAQDYGALEIVVADNASTDATPEIIASHVAVDDRVRVITNPENLGAAENYNIAFRESRGKYFAWNAHDDYTSPDFISEGVKVLENDPTAVIAFGRLVIVDAIGQRRKDKELPVPEGLRSPSPAVRFRATARGAPEIVVFGLIRSSTLKTTDLHGAFTGSDRNLVAELMLHGTAVQAGDSEFYLRHHDQRSVRLIQQAESRCWLDCMATWVGSRRQELVAMQMTSLSSRDKHLIQQRTVLGQKPRHLCCRERSMNLESV